VTLGRGRFSILHETQFLKVRIATLSTLFVNLKVLVLQLCLYHKAFLQKVLLRGSAVDVVPYDQVDLGVNNYGIREN